MKTRWAALLLACADIFAGTAGCFGGSAMAQSSPEPVRAGAERNVYIAGGQARPGAPVEGDFVAVGGRVIIDQPVKGDAAVAGGAVDLRAPLGDDLRAVGGDITVESSVGGEVFAGGGNVTLGRGARVAGSATLFGGSVTIDGRVGGALRATAQRIAINGEIAGDVHLAGEQIALGPTARIAGALRYASPTEFVKAEGAVVTGAISREEWGSEQGMRSARGRRGGDEGHGGWRMARDGQSGSGWWGAVLTFFALLASGALLLLIFPRFAGEAADTVRRAPGLSFLLGFAAVVAVPVLAVMLFITLLGIPLGIALVVLYPLLLLGGYIVGVLFIARRVQAALRPGAPAVTAPGRATATATAPGVAPARATTWQTLGFFALALLLVLLLGRLPWVGGLVVGAIAVVGIGACVLEIHRRRQGGAAGERGGTAPAA